MRPNSQAFFRRTFVPTNNNNPKHENNSHTQTSIQKPFGLDPKQTAADCHNPNRVL